MPGGGWEAFGAGMSAGGQGLRQMLAQRLAERERKLEEEKVRAQMDMQRQTLDLQKQQEGRLQNLQDQNSATEFAHNLPLEGMNTADQPTIDMMTRGGRTGLLSKERTIPAKPVPSMAGVGGTESNPLSEILSGKIQGRQDAAPMPSAPVGPQMDTGRTHINSMVPANVRAAYAASETRAADAEARRLADNEKLQATIGHWKDQTDIGQQNVNARLTTAEIRAAQTEMGQKLLWSIALMKQQGAVTHDQGVSAQNALKAAIKAAGDPNLFNSKEAYQAAIMENMGTMGAATAPPPFDPSQYNPMPSHEKKVTGSSPGLAKVVAPPVKKDPLGLR